MTRYLTVFLSSTAKDLQAYRDAVYHAIHRLPGYHCVRMEEFGARPGTAEEVCRAAVAEADLFVGLIGHLHGSRPKGSELSYTEMEVEAATKAGKPLLLYLAAKGFELPADLRESDRAWKRQQRFRERLRGGQVVDFFGQPQDLATRVVAALPQAAAALRARGTRGRKARSRSAGGAVDLVETERVYREHLADRYQYLDFRGMGMADRVPLRLPLREMYVPLKARVQTPEGETWSRGMRLAGRRLSEAEAEALGERLSEPRPVLDLLRASPGLILLGDPGSGKTTFLKLLALELAAGGGEALGLGRRVPVLVPLSAYANALAMKDIPLRAFLPRYFEERGLDLPLTGFLEKKLGSGELLLLLDGLDEVREVENRSLVVERVADFYSRHRKAGNKFVLTSRVVGYREVRPAAEGLAEATLVDFDEEEIEAFVDRWTAAIEKAAVGDTRLAREGAEREREELLAAVRGNPGVRSLAANPLLLTILALMKRQGVTLPERRVELYQRYVETLLKHWNLARSLAGRPVKDLDLLETLRILQPLALWMHESSPGVGLVKEGDLHRELARIFGERGEGDAERAAQRFLEDVREHTSLLLDRGGRQYGFIHLTFQEYLAAAALAQRGQEEVTPVVDALSAHVGEAPWHEVSLLTLGYMGLVQQRDKAAGSVIEELLERAPGLPGEAAALAGRAVADMGRGGVSAACRAKVVEALVSVLRDDGAVKPRRRAAAGKVLADVGDLRPEVMTVDGMELCWVPAGSFVMGSEPDDKKAYEEEKPQGERTVAYGFWMGRYPVTVAQYEEVCSRRRGRKGLVNSPVAEVSWYDAVSFCASLTERWRGSGRLEEGWEVCLPSEAEWEKAARGGLSVPSKAVVRRAGEAVGVVRTKMRPNPRPERRNPWGQGKDLNRANCSVSGIGMTSTVGIFPSGASPYGCEEMSGNVWEWTRSLWGEDSEKPSFAYPYDATDGRENMKASAQVLRVVRGATFYDISKNGRCACRGRNSPDAWHHGLGFRVVLSPLRS